MMKPLRKGSTVRVRPVGRADWSAGTIIMASENGESLLMELDDGGLYTGHGLMLGALPLVVHNGKVYELLTGVELEVEVGTLVAHFDLTAEDFPVLLEALHPATRVVVWSKTIEIPGAVEIPALLVEIGHPVAIRYTSATGRTYTEEPPMPPAPDTVH